LPLRINRHILCTACGVRKDDGGERRSYGNLPHLWGVSGHSRRGYGPAPLKEMVGSIL
jgi:hypothetical protein